MPVEIEHVENAPAGRTLSCVSGTSMTEETGVESQGLEARERVDLGVARVGNLAEIPERDRVPPP